MSGEFRQHLFPHDHPRLAEVRGLDAYAYREHARTPGTFTGGLVEGWTPLYLSDFRGVTEDGAKRAAGEGGQDAAVQLVDLEITLNGQDYLPYLPHTSTYSYYSLDAIPSGVAVLGARPNGGPSGGGTLVDVTGVGFVDRGNILCHFGASPEAGASAARPNARASAARSSAKVSRRPTKSKRRGYASMCHICDMRWPARSKLSFVPLVAA